MFSVSLSSCLVCLGTKEYLRGLLKKYNADPNSVTWEDEQLENDFVGNANRCYFLPILTKCGFRLPSDVAGSPGVGLLASPALGLVKLSYND